MKELIQAKIDKYKADKAEHVRLVTKYNLPNNAGFFEEVIADLQDLLAKA